MLWSVLRGRPSRSALLRGKPAIPKRASWMQSGPASLPWKRGEEAAGGGLGALPGSLRSLVSPGHLPGAVQGRLVPKLGHRCWGPRLIRWGQSAATAVKAWKHLLCKGVEQTVACWAFSSVETLSSVVKGVPMSVGAAQRAFSPQCLAPVASGIPEAPWVGGMWLSILEFLAAGAGWQLEPRGSRLAQGLAAPTATPPSPLPLFPTPPCQGPALHPGSLSNSTEGVVSISINQLYPDNLRRFKHQYPK